MTLVMTPPRYMDMDIELLLAHADSHAPVLVEGLSAITSDAPARSPGRLLDSSSLLSDRLGERRWGFQERTRGGVTPDDLDEQRWAIIAPTGSAGDRLLRAIEPLRQRRSREQGGEAIVYRVDPAMTKTDATRWMQTAYWDMVDRRQDLLPRYLLILGDASEVSWDFQQILSCEAFVGRLAFADVKGYEAYVHKVCRWEEAEHEPRSSALFFTARDGTSATNQGYAYLMEPSRAYLEMLRATGKCDAREIMELPYDETALAGRGRNLDTVLRASAETRGGLLFSMSHGIGAPRDGWKSSEEQRLQQGAMLLGRETLAAPDLSAQPFLPGGLWFFFACFSAGTPTESAYYRWLESLHRVGRCGDPRPVLASLPKQGEPPFVAAAPQAALANPDGPLGVIGHVDLAWTWGFRDSGFSPGVRGDRSRAERFHGTLRALLRGHRFGVAHQELVRFAWYAGREIIVRDNEDGRVGVQRTPDDTWEVQDADLWLQRHDLGAYVLLGDPAARLPIAHLPAGISRVTKGPTRARGA